MNRPIAQLSALFVALVLLGAGAAHAQQAPAAPPPQAAPTQAAPSQTAPPQVAPPQAAPPQADTGAVRAPEAPSSIPAPPNGEPRVHMRSSHTVDVIAPGEKVDTILGRMRMERPAPPPRNDAVRPPPGPESHGGHPQGPGRSGPRPGEEGRGPPTSPRTDGNLRPPSSPPPPPPR